MPNYSRTNIQIYRPRRTSGQTDNYYLINAAGRWYTGFTESFGALELRTVNNPGDAISFQFKKDASDVIRTLKVGAPWRIRDHRTK